jgi:hypothetical protein
LKATWIGHVYLRNCILKHVNEGKIEVTGVEEGRRRKLVRDDLKETEEIRNWKKHYIAISGELALEEAMGLY